MLICIICNHADHDTFKYCNKIIKLTSVPDYYCNGGYNKNQKLRDIYTFNIKTKT